MQLENLGTVNLEDYLAQITSGNKKFEVSVDENNGTEAEITVNGKHKFFLKDNLNGNVEIIYQGVAGNLMLSETSGTYTYPTSGTFTVIKNVSGGELSVSTDAPDVATATISGNTVTVVPQGTKGEATITVKSSANGEYGEEKVKYTATVVNGTITLSATPYSGNYDGTAHNALTNVTVNPTDCTLEYQLNGGSWTPTMPQVTGANEEGYTISVKASKAGYETITITETVKVGKQQNTNGNLSLSANSGTYTILVKKTRKQ